MARLFVLFLAIYNNKNWLNSIKIIMQVNKIKQILKMVPLNCLIFLEAFFISLDF